MSLYIKAGRKSVFVEESERLKLLRVAVWGEPDEFDDALKQIIKD